MKKIITAAIFAFVLLCSAPLKAGEAQVRAFISDSGYALIEALGCDDVEQKYQILDELFDQRVDTDYIAKFVLGVYYNKMNDAQKARYHMLFGRYIKSLYKSYPLNFKTPNIDFDIVGVRQNGAFYDVKCMVDLPEQYQSESLKQIGLEFRVRENADVIKLIDFKIDTISMLLTFKNKLMQMIKDDEEEMDWFLEDFEDLTLSNEMQAKQ